MNPGAEGEEGRDRLVRLTDGKRAGSCSCTEWPIVHGSAPYEAIVGIEVALAKAHSYPVGNHGCKAILELGSHAQHTLGAGVKHSRTRAICSVQAAGLHTHTCCSGAWGSSPSEYSRNRACSAMKGKRRVLLVKDCVVATVQIYHRRHHVTGGIHETQLFQGRRYRSPLSFACTPVRRNVTCDACP